MKRNKVIRMIFALLLIVTISGGLTFFHMQYGFWWDRPDLRNDIEKIVLREVEFTPHVGDEHIKATKALVPESPGFHKIVKTIESGWKYESMAILKIPSYTVEITHTDGSETKIEVFGEFIRIKSPDDVEIYRSMRNVSEIIEAELKTTE